jgi:hypothetical protein
MAADNEQGAQVPPADEARTESHDRPRSWRGIAVLVAGVALALGFAVYFGIRGRLEAAGSLERRTEQAAVLDVVVVHPKANPPTEEITLPGGTQAYISSPISPSLNRRF